MESRVTLEVLCITKKRILNAKERIMTVLELKKLTQQSSYGEDLKMCGCQFKETYA